MGSEETLRVWEGLDEGLSLAVIAGDHDVKLDGGLSVYVSGSVVLNLSVSWIRFAYEIFYVRDQWWIFL